MKQLMLLLLVSNIAMADDWFCKHEAGKREGNTVWSCGVGEATDESTARHYALKDAEREFAELCSISSDCAGLEKTVDPQRTTCDPYNGHIKCYRLLITTLRP